jgi:Amt family ammonium transporter
MGVLGAGILWFGWFGFNAGSEVMVDGITVSAWTVTNTATGMAAVTWVLMSWAHTGKPSIVGAASGAVAGLVARLIFLGQVGCDGWRKLCALIGLSMPRSCSRK